MVKIYNPSPALADYICCYWSLDNFSTSHTELVYPCGKIQLIFHYRKPFIDRNSSGYKLTQPQFALCGQKTSFSHITASENSGMIAAVLKTDGASALLHMPLNEITDTTISLTDIFKHWKNSEQEFTDCPDDISKIRMIENFLIKNITFSSSCHEFFVKACVNEMKETKGMSLPYRSMERFSLSERSLQRIFREQVGLSPKKFAEIVRLENSIALFRDGRAMTDICYEAGYYDQPHFIKSFRQFTGLTPAEFQNLM